MFQKFQDLLGGRSPRLKGGTMVDDPADLTAIATAHRLSFTREIHQPLLLISEIQRSGGTLLSQLLDGHPQIYAHPHELKIGRPSKYFWPKLDLNSSSDELWGNLRENRVVKQALAGYRKASPGGEQQDYRLPFIFSQPLQKTIFTRMVAAQSQPTQRQVLAAYVTSYFNAWIDYQGLYRDPASVKFWSAFTPRLTMEEAQCAAVFRDYPDGCLLSVIRNPKSWFASARKHQPREYKLEKAVELWLEATRAALRNLANFSDRVTLIHFDDLVKNTESTMRAVCTRTGLDFSPSLLSPTFNGLPMSANTSFSAGKPGTILKATADRAKELDDAEAAYIQEHTETTYREALAKTVNVT